MVEHLPRVHKALGSNPSKCIYSKQDGIRQLITALALRPAKFQGQASIWARQKL